MAVLPSGTILFMLAGTDGIAEIPFHAGGICHGSLGGIRVHADGVMLADGISVASADQNGDGIVDGVDAALLSAKLGGPFDPTGDLNCSSALEGGDLAVQALHAGHSCLATVPVRPDTRGRIKTLYR